MVTDTHFHRLFHAQPNYRWWRPLLELLVFALLSVVFLMLAFGGVYLVGHLVGADLSAMDELMDMYDPWVFTSGMLTLISLLPAALLAARWGGRRPAGLLWSVAGRIRWRVLGTALLPTFIVLLLTYILNAALVADFAAFTLDRRALVLLALTVVLVPLQATAEELVFRGVVPQLLGAWVKHPAVAYLASVPLFVIGHTYDAVGLTDIAVFAVCTSLLTHYTGGLEAAMALHIVNNLLAFSTGAVGLSDLNSNAFPPIAVLVSITGTVVLTAWLLYDRRMKDAIARSPRSFER